MIIVSDTTPLHYLILIDEVELLPRLFGEIVIPNVVFQELQAEKTPEKIKKYLKNKPNWLSIRQPTGIVDQELDEIDPGEQQAILLAEQLAADGVLIDDRAGRIVAVRRGLRVVGTIGVLERAAESGLVVFFDSLNQIKSAGFYLSPSFEAELKKKYTIN